MQRRKVAHRLPLPASNTDFACDSWFGFWLIVRASLFSFGGISGAMCSITTDFAISLVAIVRLRVAMKFAERLPAFTRVANLTRHAVRVEDDRHVDISGFAKNEKGIFARMFHILYRISPNVSTVSV
jgi:hypothetical protein